VERSLHSIINKSIDEKVIPHVTDAVSKIVEKKLGEILPRDLPRDMNAAVGRELKTSLPNALQQALKDSHVQRTISDQVASKVSSMLQHSTQATQKMVADAEARTQQRLEEVDAHRQQDNAKIDELIAMVQSLNATVKSLAETTSKGQQAPIESALAQEPVEEEEVEAVDPEKKAEDDEISRITTMLMAGDYENATISVSHANILNIRMLMGPVVAAIRPPGRALRQALHPREPAVPAAGQRARQPVRVGRHHGHVREQPARAPRLARDGARPAEPRGRGHPRRRAQHPRRPRQPPLRRLHAHLRGAARRSGAPEDFGVESPGDGYSEVVGLTACCGEEGDEVVVISIMGRGDACDMEGKRRLPSDAFMGMTTEVRSVSLRSSHGDGGVRGPFHSRPCLYCQKVCSSSTRVYVKVVWLFVLCWVLLQ